MHNAETSRTSRSKATILLLVVLYLGIFTAHDLIFLHGDFHGELKESHVDFSYFEEKMPENRIDAVNDHYCPFCSGFVDDHAEAGFNVSDSTLANVIELPEESIQSFTSTFNNPRDPPSKSI